MVPTTYWSNHTATLHIGDALQVLAEMSDDDLDAIAGGDPALALYADLMSDGFHLWIDAGVKEAPRVRQLADRFAARPRHRQ